LEDGAAIAAMVAVELHMEEADETVDDDAALVDFAKLAEEAGLERFVGLADFVASEEQDRPV